MSQPCHFSLTSQYPSIFTILNSSTPIISSIPRLICSSRILDQCRIGALSQPRVNPDIKACVVEGRGAILEPIQVKTCYRASALLRSAPLCYINNLFNHIKYSILISFCPLCSPHLVDPHKTYQQQVKGLSAPHHFILNINNRTFTKSSFGWMESRP